MYRENWQQRWRVVHNVANSLIEDDWRDRARLGSSAYEWTSTQFRKFKALWDTRIHLSTISKWLLQIHIFPRTTLDGSGTFRSLVFSLPVTKVPGNFRFRERKFPGTFIPGSKCSQEHSFCEAIYQGANCTSNFKSHIMHKLMLKPIFWRRCLQFRVRVNWALQ